jgi:hypothetical protein
MLALHIICTEALDGPHARLPREPRASLGPTAHGPLSLDAQGRLVLSVRYHLRMRFQSLRVRNLRAVRVFEASDLQDFIMIAGPNGCESLACSMLYAY